MAVIDMLLASVNRRLVTLNSRGMEWLFDHDRVSVAQCGTNSCFRLTMGLRPLVLKAVGWSKESTFTKFY